MALLFFYKEREPRGTLKNGSAYTLKVDNLIESDCFTRKAASCVGSRFFLRCVFWNAAAAAIAAHTQAI